MNLDQLLDVLRRSAGASEALDGAAADEVMDVSFENLGYDSLALLETAAAIERDFGIRLDDEAVADAVTPRLLLDLVAKAS
jgi:act minimal PKS acyl carrier protein